MDTIVTAIPKAGTELIVDLAATKISIPVVGGRTAISKAVGAK